ncbi:MAG TPA: type II toxin-antitoxin system HicA family toxin [Candidatus Methylacidiphilales bacterium]|jgi:predicted RNA binding protein YcfA (HicA-like mRNA interferase family)|nr:type II toxin-antitoxin system HicA family toxin [Candidatus Methylacidiphilales bacterium]
MPRLGVFSAREVCRILQAHGFEKVRQAGSHIIMQKRTGTDTKTVPVPNHAEIAKGTLRSIIGLSGLDAADFKK